MKTYAIIGQSAEVTDRTSNPSCPPGHIEMEGPRPTPEHVAQADGMWVIPLPTPEELRAQLTDAVQGYLDSTARQRSYDGILSLCSYATSQNAKFAAEGRAGVVFRDDVWAGCYGILEKVLAGEMPVPTAGSLLAMLPEMEWPL